MRLVCVWFPLATYVKEILSRRQKQTISLKLNERVFQLYQNNGPLDLLDFVCALCGCVQKICAVPRIETNPIGGTQEISQSEIYNGGTIGRRYDRPAVQCLF